MHPAVELVQLDKRGRDLVMVQKIAHAVNILRLDQIPPVELVSPHRYVDVDESLHDLPEKQALIRHHQLGWNGVRKFGFDARERLIDART